MSPKLYVITEGEPGHALIRRFSLIQTILAFERTTIQIRVRYTQGHEPKLADLRSATVLHAREAIVEEDPHVRRVDINPHNELNFIESWLAGALPGYLLPADLFTEDDDR